MSLIISLYNITFLILKKLSKSNGKNLKNEHAYRNHNIAFDFLDLKYWSIFENNLPVLYEENKKFKYFKTLLTDKNNIGRTHLNHAEKKHFIYSEPEV